MKFKRYEMIGILTLFLVFTYFAAAGQVQENVAGKLIRLHVIANSDTREDQALKLKVRDSILVITEQIGKDCENTDQTKEALTRNLPKIQKTAQSTVKKAGYSYPVDVELKREYYPSKSYENFALPAGDYTGLKIRIGKAAGHNWWCVVFPPLCTEAATERDFKGFTKNEKSFVREDGTRFVIRFKAAEVVEALRHRCGEN